MANLTKKQIAALITSATLLAAPVVKVSEGLVTKVYKDPIGIPTACYGHTGKDLVYGKTYTPEECNAILDKDIATAIKGVQSCVDIGVLTPGQLAAFTDFTLNTGTGTFCRSSMARLINENKVKDACLYLDKYIYANKKVFPGLVTRRNREMELCNVQTAPSS